MKLNFKTMLLTTVLAFSPLIAAEDGQPTQEATQQTVTLTFEGTNGQPFIKEVGVGEIRLDLRHNQLSEAIPETIGNLVNLQSLYLFKNQLSEAIPEEIGNLVNLIELHLCINHLTGVIPEEIGNLVNLIELHLFSNQLSGDIPKGLWMLPKLYHLNLHGNPLFGENILTNQRNINSFNNFSSVQSAVDGSCNITVLDYDWPLNSHYTDEGVWQQELIRREYGFMRFTKALQAVLIAELANYGYAQKMVFTFPNTCGTLTIHPAVNGSPREIETSEGAQLGELVEALDKLHMLLDKYYECSLNSEYPVGLIYPPLCTKNARNVSK